MAYPPKIELALNVLEHTDMWRSSYAPPLYRMLWSLGVPVRPPHFNTFLGNFLTQGIPFGVFFTAIMRFWIAPDRPLAGLLIQCVLTAVLTGLFTATWIWFRRRKYSLPAWSELDDLASRFD